MEWWQHLAWQLDASSAYGGRWVSPQVPHNLWKLFRFCLNLVGLGCLYVLASAAADRTWTHCAFATLYHLFTTVPVAAQVQACLVRTAVNLTQRRAASELEQGTYEYLMIKETCRAAWLFVVSVGVIVSMPRLVWETEGRRYKLAAFLSLCAYNLAMIGFNYVHQVLARTLIRSGMGIPIPVFEDKRDQRPRVRERRRSPSPQRRARGRPARSCSPS